MNTFKDLEVWKKSVDFVTLIYKLTDRFPRSEIYGITNQIRRASVSIPSNIAEGAGRQSHKEFIQFLYIARGSVKEVETQLIIATNLGYLKQSALTETTQGLDEIGKMITGLLSYLKNKNS
ncbi:four helix bundle protein [Sphingobacterium psychroaquaticum]|uniref:Four helix bundle protein n=1 Tax=Sphingobacterium psychroaquaticum TaxID=561061 RepID=A0A1X7KJX3_9SPHI|nr:four helix bundle protein [Sphingobacterium psychroaquaticum]SMG41292.1 four helix bundle protein [Sphingobacterium psychroaquaticum]